MSNSGGDLDSTTGIEGGTDGTKIGNVLDRLKVDAASTTFGSVFRQGEVTVASKAETDLAATSYTVATAKTFVLTSLSANYDTQSPVIIRLKKQTAGAGAFALVWRMTLKQHGQDTSNINYTVPFGVIVGVAGDVFKITYESALAKGSLWAAFTGLEY